MKKITYTGDEGQVSVYGVHQDGHHVMDLLVDYGSLEAGKAPIAIADPARTKIVTTKGLAKMVVEMTPDGVTSRPSADSVKSYVRPRMSTLAFRLYAIA